MEGLEPAPLSPSAHQTRTGTADNAQYGVGYADTPSIAKSDGGYRTTLNSKSQGIYNNLSNIPHKKPFSDEELIKIIKGGLKNFRLLPHKLESEIIELATNPKLLEMENIHRFATQTDMLENEFMKLKPQLKNEVEHGLILASFDVRNDKELLARINDALDLAPRAKSPDKIIFEPLEYKGEKYVVGFNGELIYAEKLENPKKPTSYDELKALEQKERDDFEDIKTQYEKISEIREKGTTEPNKTLENNTKELDSDNLHENKDIDFNKENLTNQDSTATKEIIKQINTEKQKQNIDENLLKTLRKEMEQELNIKPLEEFGQNYAEHYHNGKAAIDELLKQKQGQVAGAFHREDLGDIDLVWGEVKGSGSKAEGFGLAKILEKHMHDFSDFAGDSKEKKLINGLAEIVERGNVVKDGDRATLRYEKNGNIFKVGLKGNWKGEPTKNKWIITAYNDEKESIKTIDSNAFTKDETLSLNSDLDSTTNPQTNLTKAQAKKQEVLAKKQYKQELSDLKKKLLSAKKDAISFRDKEYDSNVGAGGATVKSSKKGGYVKPLPQDKLSKEKRYRQSLEYFSRENNISYILVDEYIDALNNKQSKEVLEKILQKIHESQKENERALKELQAEADKDIQDFKKSLSNKSIDEIENIYENYKNKHIFDMTQEQKEHRHIVRDALLRLPHTYDINVSNILRVLKGKFLDFKDSDYLLSKDKADAAILQRDRNTIQKHFGINVLRDFGTNYAEFVRDGRGAIQKILLEAKDYEERAKAGKLSDFEISQGQYKGQVAGAFHREDLGDIDLVWGEVKGSGSKVEGFGLAKILEKHIDDFSDFAGDSKEKKLINGLAEIVESGKVIDENGVKTI